MITKIHVVLTTQKLQNSGTKSNPVLILGQNNRDYLHHTFALPEGGIQDGSSFHLTLDNTDPEFPIYPQWSRLGIRGADAWWPEFVFLWGDQDDPQQGGYRIQPIGVENFTPFKLSTDESEGRLSIPLKQAYIGGPYTRLQRMLIMVENSDKPHAGTKGDIFLRFYTQKGLLTEVSLGDERLSTPGGLLVAIHYPPADYYMNEITTILLETASKDAWLPQSFYIFAFDNQADDYEAIVPLVNISNWSQAGMGQLSSDPGEGDAQVVLYRAFL